MTIAMATDYLRQSISMLLTLVLPIVGSGLVIGLAVSLFQAVTQIQEQTLTFVPKMVVVFIVLSLAFPWIASSLQAWVITMWSEIPKF
ncbi:MAG: flagellar biosynthetic protein FliQ [Candidatus Margulisbacteria bacterium GWF2_35_9]|nr:MAG: flagellar biosynthetic protein FliQ [Candidatus Margulisbacteria bacterium GWF2_35_9]